MTSGVIVTIKLDSYHRAFLRSYFDQPNNPFNFHKGHDLLKRLEVLLRPEPEIVKRCDYGDDAFVIEVPPFQHKNPLTYCHLSETAAKIFASKIADFTQLIYHEKLTAYRNAGFEFKECALLFMDEFNLPDDCYDRLIKDQSRWRWNMRYKDSKRFKKKRNKLSPVGNI